MDLLWNLRSFLQSASFVPALGVTEMWLLLRLQLPRSGTIDSTPDPLT